MRTRLKIVALALIALVSVLGVSASAATVTVPPGGDIVGAYNAAQDGDTIRLEAGSYGDVRIPSGTKKVTVQGVEGTRMRTLHNSAQNIVFDTIDVDAGGVKTSGPVVENHGAGSVVRNSRIGDVVDQIGLLSGAGCVGCAYENILFHDVLVETAGVHNECLYSQSPSVKIHNSRFENCATFDVFFTRGDWWGQPTYGGFELTGNHFGKTYGLGGRDASNPQVHYYSVYWGNVAEVVRGVKVRGNRFELPAVAPDKTVEGVESCNTPPPDLEGITHVPCDSTDPTPDPTPQPTPYAPACEPTCDEQIATLTRERDEEERKALIWRDKLSRIRAILDE